MPRHVNGNRHDERPQLLLLLDLLRLLAKKLSPESGRKRERGWESRRDAYFTCHTPSVTQFSVFRFPSAGYIKISSRTVLFLCPSYYVPLSPFSMCYTLLQLLAVHTPPRPSPLILLVYPFEEPSRRANKSCAQSVDINFVSLLFRAKLLTDNAQEQCAIIIPFFRRREAVGGGYRGRGIMVLCSCQKSAIKCR